MNCLLTGLNGFLGKIISQQISESNKIFGLSRNGSDFQVFLEKEVPDFNLQFDLVIHAAGKVHSVPKTESEKREFYQVNVVGSQNLLKGLTKSGIPKYFVFISSVSVYGQDFGSDIDEISPLAAEDSYGLSKIESERIVLDWCKKNNVVCTILRLPLIVGPNPPGNLGAMIKGIHKGYYFNIAGGRAKKSMVLAEDVAKAILSVAEIGGIYNLTDGYHPSFAELSNHIFFQLGKGKPMNMPFWLARIASNLGDLLGNKAPLNTNKLMKITSDLTFDDTKAREVFGWNPTPVLEGFKLNPYAQ
tara:strand:+ start:639 stop:1544 length:906 start_codon:yes stop_codon:yes gene_type:complete